MIVMFAIGKRKVQGFGFRVPGSVLRDVFASSTEPRTVKYELDPQPETLN